MSVRVLIVDDHGIMREGLRAILGMEDDVEVVGEARDGREAVEVVRALAPDVIVMDIGLPELNGIEATREIRSFNAASRIIALSTYSDERYVVEMLQAGASGYVPKVCARDELRHAIHAAKRGKPYLSPEVAEILLKRSLGKNAASEASAYTLLGPRERQILQLLAEGKTSPQIAERLCLSVRTVDTHRRNLMNKLGVHGIAELTKYAVREGLTSLRG